jgi:acyl-CoA thioesterase I
VRRPCLVVSMPVPASEGRAATAPLGRPKPGPPKRRRDVFPTPRSAADFDDLRDPTACTVRYSRLDREPGLQVYPNLAVLNDEVVAGLLGCEPDHLREVRSALASVLNVACNELFASPGFEGAIRSLPFAPDDVVVTVGDSITADALSWVELLVSALRRAGGVLPAVINAAVSSITSSDLIANFEPIALKNPSHVIVMIGTNDARRHGPRGEVRMVSPSETARNLQLYGEMVRSRTRADLMFLTPPPVHEERVNRHRPFTDGHVSWRSNEVEELAEIVRRQDCSVVDIHHAFLGPNVDSYLSADGVHPSVAGQKRIVTVLVNALTHDGKASGGAGPYDRRPRRGSPNHPR